LMRTFLFLALLFPPFRVEEFAQQVTVQDLDKVLERADKLLDEAKVAYEDARSKGSVAAYVDAGFKLEEARIKYLALQEIGPADKQKIASERLRAVNQLSKLIHDGKVAISGSPTESTPAKPTDPSPAPPTKEPAPIPAAQVPVDVTKRAAVPDAAKQREAEKLVRDLFKDNYAKKAPADRKALARLLLNQAAKSQDDLVALWVLYSEAQDAAAQGCDVKAALEAVEAAARFFDVDALAMKYTALTATSKTAKAPEDFLALTEALLKLIDDLVLADQFDTAERATILASQHARKSNDSALALRATTRVREVGEAKTLFQAMKSVHETLARNPDDPGANLEIGKFLCFVKGSWDLGLRFMAKGSDPTLKSIAEKELAFPLQSADRGSLADGWYDLSEKEKSPLRKSQLLAHAKAVYESALVDAVALVRAKIEKRLADIDAGDAIDLLALIDSKLDVVNGQWTREGRALVCSFGRYVRFQVPYEPPDEYDLQIQCVRRQGGSLGIGLGVRCPGMLNFEGWPGPRSGLENIDGKRADNNPTTWRAPVFTNERPTVILIAVRKLGVSVVADEKKIIDWKGDRNHLSMPSDWVAPNPRVLWVGSWDGVFQMDKMLLTPVSRQGKKLR